MNPLIKYTTREFILLCGVFNGGFVKDQLIGAH